MMMMMMMITIIVIVNALKYRLSETDTYIVFHFISLFGFSIRALPKH